MRLMCSCLFVKSIDCIGFLFVKISRQFVRCFGSNAHARAIFITPSCPKTGGQGIVRLWDATSFGHRPAGGCASNGGKRVNGGGGGGGGDGGKCAAHFIAHQRGLSSLCFSSDDRLLCTVGGDEHRRTQVRVCVCVCACVRRAARDVVHSTHAWGCWGVQGPAEIAGSSVLAYLPAWFWW